MSTKENILIFIFISCIVFILSASIYEIHCDFTNENMAQAERNAKIFFQKSQYKINTVHCWNDGKCVASTYDGKEIYLICANKTSISNKCSIDHGSNK